MAGALITIEIEDAAARRAIAALISRLANPSRAMRAIGEHMVRSTDEHFRREKSPDGTPWPQNSDITLLRYLERRAGSFRKRRTATGGRTLTRRGMARLAAKKILRDGGYLQDTIRYQLEDRGRAVAIGTDRVYGAMQQFGGTRARWPHLWGDIPPRPFLGTSSDDRNEILAILTRHLARAVP